MGETGAEFGHFVYFVYSATLEEVQTVKVFVIMGEENLMVNLFNAQHGFENRTLALLNPLSHGMKVGGKVNRCRENALVVLAFALTIK